MSQNRVFYACQAVLYRKRNTKSGGTYAYLDGAQSVGVSSTSESSSIVDIGRFQRRFRFENKNRTHEINISRIIPRGGQLFYYDESSSTNYNQCHLLSNTNLGCQGSDTYTNSSGLKNYDIIIVYGEDDVSLIQDSATLTKVSYKNCLLTNISYDIGVDQITETITLISNIIKYDDGDVDELPNSAQDGDILKRQHIKMSSTILPEEANQIFKLNSPLSIDNKDVFGLQSIQIEATIDYTELNDIGIWRGANDETDVNLWKFVNLPISITCSLVGVIRSIYLYQDILRLDKTFEENKQIKIVADALGSQYFVWDLGTKNYLDNISTSGGDTGGGNVELTLSYKNDYSDLVQYKGATIRSISNTGPY
jgi:hypothetical protein